jgi:acetyl-CoA carboxylase carboxyl transferase alpha subunit
MVSFLDFEKPVAALDARIAELRETAQSGELDIDNEIAKLQQRSAKMLADTYAKLTPWQKTQVARHPERPHFKHYVAGIFDEFLPLAGDRAFGDDQAILGGFAKLGKRRVMVIGHEKGDDTASRLRHNFGMGKPEGYRKAIRLMQLADRFGLPVVTLGGYVRRLSRRAGRGARAGGSHRALDRAMPCAWRADGRGDRGRGRLGRRDRAGRRQPGADVRTCGLFA